MKLKFVAAAVIAAASMSSAMAAANGFWYGLGALGGVYANSDLHDDAVAALEETGLGGTVKTHEGSVTGKVILGYQFNDYFALEGGYYYLGKTDTKINAANGLATAKGKITSHMLGLDAVCMYPLINVVSLFAKGGFGIVRSKSTASFSTDVVDFNMSESSTKTRLAPKIGFGVEWDINDYISIRSEYEGIFKACKEGDSLSDVDYHLFTVGLKSWF